MFTFIAALAATVAAQPAGITYLDCSATQRGEPVHYSITLNEAEGSVDWDLVPGNGFPARRDAARFTPDAVYFQAFRINRVTLALVRQYENLLGETETETGTCKITPQVNRAF